MLIKRTGLFLVVVLATIVMLLASCGPAAVEEIAPETGPVGRVTLVSYSSHWECRGGDMLTANSAWDTRLCQMHGESLIGKDREGKFRPELAESWKYSEDFLSIEFTLNEDAMFQNGDPFTAEDVKYTIERAERPELNFTYGPEMKRKIESVEVVDDHHVIFHMKEPYPLLFDRMCAYLKICPKKYCEEVGDEEYAKHPIGAGPFRWVDYQQDIFHEHEAVIGHYRKTPDVKFIRTLYVPEATTRMAMLKTGEVDIIDCPEEYIPDVEEDPNLRIVWVPYCKSNQLCFGEQFFPEQDLPFHDKRVRQAACYAIDTATVCDKVMHGAGTPFSGSLAPYQYGFDPELAKPHPYDPEKAKALLTEAGYPDGFDTQLITYMGQKAWCEAAASYLNAVGIRAKMNMVDAATWAQIAHERSEPGLFYLNLYYGSPYCNDAALRFAGGEKGGEALWGYGTTPELKRLASKLMLTVDPEEADKIANEMNKVYLDAVIRIDMFAYNGAKAIGPRIEYFEPMYGGLEYLRHEYIRLKPE